MISYLHRRFSCFKVFLFNNWPLCVFVALCLVVLGTSCCLFHCLKGADKENYSSDVGLIAGLVTIVSIVLVYETLRRSRIVSEAQLLSNYNDKYFKNKMLNAIRLLRSFSKEHEKNFICHRTPCCNPRGAFYFLDDDNLWWTPEVDVARRRLKGYFINALDLYEQGMLSYNVFIKILNKSGITTLFGIVEPMEWYLNPKYDASKFHRLMAYASHIYKGQLETEKSFETPKVRRVRALPAEVAPDSPCCSTRLLTLSYTLSAATLTVCGLVAFHAAQMLNRYRSER